MSPNQRSDPNPSTGIEHRPTSERGARRSTASLRFPPGIRGCWLLVALPFCALFAAAASGAEPESLLQDFGRDQLILETRSKGCILFDVYVAADSERWQQGLMYVRKLGQYEGMIFVYPGAREITMWMKNTFIPLDMVFVSDAGRVAHLHPDAVPHNTAVISSEVAVSQVIELNAGSIQSLGIQKGDLVIFPAG